LSHTFTVASGDLIYISTDGAITNGSSVTGDKAKVEIAVFVDGVQVTSGLDRVVTAMNIDGNSGVGLWSMSAVIPTPSAGSHTITVKAKHAGDAGETSTVSASSGANQGALTVTVIRN